MQRRAPGHQGIRAHPSQVRRVNPQHLMRACDHVRNLTLLVRVNQRVAHRSARARSQQLKPQRRQAHPKVRYFPIRKLQEGDQRRPDQAGDLQKDQVLSAVDPWL